MQSIQTKPYQTKEGGGILNIVKTLLSIRHMLLGHETILY